MISTRSKRALTIVVVAVVACSIGLTLALPAMAAPKGIFGVFAQCPTRMPGDELCVVGEVASGEMSIGAVKVPIGRTLVLRGGEVPVGYPEHPSEIEFFVAPAKGGETLSKNELEVPGGLQSLVNVNCPPTLTGCKVSASIELLTNNPRDRAIINEFAFFNETAGALILPVRIRLNNPFLGNGCYIGSELTPLQLQLTDGETHPPAGVKPLRGHPGNAETLEERGEVALRLRGASLVSNTFPVPGAEGCGIFRSLVDSRLKIPNKAGENAAVLNGTFWMATAAAVLASEKW